MFIDAIGKACPMPVILAKNAMDQGETDITVIVDNEIAVQNLKRLAGDKKYAVCVNELEGNFHVSMLRDSSIALKSKEKEESCYIPCSVGYTVFVGKDTVGAGDEELGHNLMKMALYTLSQSDNVPECLIFMNSGVKLPTSNIGQIIDSLETLAVKGCQIIVCGTCLDFYGLTADLKVGKISNMYEILSKMQTSSKVITL